MDVVVLAHEDLPALERSLDALLRHARPPYALFLADPGAPPAVSAWLGGFAKDQGATLFSGASAFADAIGAGSARYVFCLDGRAHVAEDVVDRLIACLSADADTAAVIPIAADVPEAGPAFERARVALASGEAEAATLLAAESARLFPDSAGGGGCALLARRAALPAAERRRRATSSPGCGRTGSGSASRTTRGSRAPPPRPAPRRTASSPESRPASTSCRNASP